jgi:hypothetical protein
VSRCLETYETRGRMSKVVAGGVTTNHGIVGLGQRIVKSGSGGGVNEYVYAARANWRPRLLSLLG